MRKALRFVTTACVLFAALPAHAIALPNDFRWPPPMARTVDLGLAADLDGDGKLDIIVTTANGQRVAGRIRADVQLSTGLEPFAIEFLAAEVNISVHLRDVDGDNQPDLIFFGTDTNRTAAVWLNRGSGVFIEAELPGHESSFLRGEPARGQWFPEPDITPLPSETQSSAAIVLPILPGQLPLRVRASRPQLPFRTATRLLHGPARLRAP